MTRSSHRPTLPGSRPDPPFRILTSLHASNRARPRVAAFYAPASRTRRHPVEVPIPALWVRKTSMRAIRGRAPRSPIATSKRSRVTLGAGRAAGADGALPGFDVKKGGLGSPAQALALATLCAVLFLTFLDNTIVSVGLANVQSDLHAGVTSLQWVVNGYALTFASFMLAAGMLGDILGRKRIMLAGVAIFCVGSVVAALAGNVDWLIAGRVIMGVGAAASEPGTLSIIRHVYPDRETRADALGRVGGRVRPRPRPRPGHRRRAGRVLRAGGPSSGSTWASASWPSSWPPSSCPRPSDRQGRQHRRRRVPLRRRASWRACRSR